MKKKTALVLFLFLAVLSPLMADKLIFTEFGVSYGSIITGSMFTKDMPYPVNLANNSTGTYDSALFDAKVGASFLRWGQIYIGAGFDPFILRNSTEARVNDQENYSFTPVFVGIRANIFPEWPVYPGFMFEYGKAAANLHSQYMVTYPTTPPRTAMVDVDNGWASDYYNFGFSVNWNYSDNAVLSLKVERPTFSNFVKSYGEIQILKAGLAWQIYY
jgi:hypothetical protein